MSDTYSKHADICAKFYELTLDSRRVADFVFSKSRAVSGQKALFVGGMFGVADELSRALELTVVDYTDEMVAIGRQKLPGACVMLADLRALPFDSEFDLVLVVGRVFTHMINNSDLAAALQGCKRSLRPDGKLFADNYESSRIQVTSYFNGEVKCCTDDITINRSSTTERLTLEPFVVRWDATYSGHLNGKEFYFADSINHRAFSRAEFADDLCDAGFQVLEQGDNFDETSFYSLAINAM